MMSRIVRMLWCSLVGHRVRPNPLISYRRALGITGGEYECAHCEEILDDPALREANRRGLIDG